MSRLYLLDTKVLAGLIKDPRGRIFERILKVGADNICTSAIAAAELYYAAEHKSDRHLTRNLREVMSEIEVKPFTLSAAQEYGRLRAALQAEGLTLAAHDMLIVAHAIELDATLVTADTDFKSATRYAKISNWR